MKKSYTLPMPKMWLLLTILLIACFGTPFLVIILQLNLMGVDSMTEFNTEYGGPIIIFLVFPIVVSVVALTLTRRLYYKKAEVTLDDYKLTIRQANGTLLCDAPISSIHTIFFSDAENGKSLKIWDVNEKLIASFTSNLLVGSKYMNNMSTLCNDLAAATQATIGKSIPKGSAWSRPGTYYHSTTSKAGLLPTRTVEKNIKKKSIKSAAIALAICVVVLVGVFYFLGKNKGYYEFEDNGNVTYNGKVLEGVNAEEFRTHSYDTGRDCTYVYYKGKRQEQLDIKTFRIIGGYLFIDKNGIYREPRWNGDELVKLDGVDKETFREVTHRLYADKNYVYTLDLMAENPLVPIKGDDAPDAASLEEIPGTIEFLKDNRYVYLKSSFSKLKRCKEIDRNSFEVLTYQVFKDKNHVYYLTHNLKQEGVIADDDEDSGEEATYDILRGAHAPSFIKLSDTEFEDENTTWYIEEKSNRTQQPSSRRKPRTR